MSGREPRTFEHTVTRWTVGQLRAALAELPDDTPLEVDYAEEPGGDMVSMQVVIGAGWGTEDWGDGRGPQRSEAYQILCEYSSGTYYLRDDRSPA